MQKVQFDYSDICSAEPETLRLRAMFKDCKSGGYNLEECKASQERLNRLVLLIAIAYTIAGLAGQKIKRQGQQKYLNRLKEIGRIEPRHSNFWLGLYGQIGCVAKSD